jgi:hypothetical protein
MVSMAFSKQSHGMLDPVSPNSTSTVVQVIILLNPTEFYTFIARIRGTLSRKLGTLGTEDDLMLNECPLEFMNFLKSLRSIHILQK